MGNYLSATQIHQLGEATRAEGKTRTIYLAFDSDPNGSGQRAAQRMSRRLWAAGMTALRLALPDGHDPNSFFVHGADAIQFQRLLEQARP
jgi:DNA primase